MFGIPNENVFKLVNSSEKQAMDVIFELKEKISDHDRKHE